MSYDETVPGAWQVSTCGPILAASTQFASFFAVVNRAVHPWSEVTYATPNPVRSISFHPSGAYLAVLTDHELLIYETVTWTTLSGVPAMYYAAGGGFTGTSFPWRVRFSPTGTRIAVGVYRGLFNSAPVSIWAFPSWASVYSDMRVEGDTNDAWLDWMDNGSAFLYAFGSLDFPSHKTALASVDIGWPGNRGGRILSGPWCPVPSGEEEGWGVLMG